MKPTFRLNPKTLAYEKVQKKTTFGVKNFFWILLSAVGFGFVFIILVAYLYPTPHEKQLKRDLAILEKNYDDLTRKMEESINMYEKLLEKDKEIHKLTFDAEIEKLESIAGAMMMYSPDFNFGQLLNVTAEKVNNVADKSDQLLWKMKLLLELAYAKKMFLQQVPAVLPLDKDNFVIVSGFGMRIHPIFKTLRQHNGIDLAARQGTPVYATGAGQVMRPPADMEGFGNTIAIDHGFGYVSVYACLLKSDVKTGNKVERGQIIGSVGRSGIASGPHLHYEVRKNGKPRNPVNYFFLNVTPEELKDFLEKASVQNQNMS
jgi:hypothetical protein